MKQNELYHILADNFTTQFIRLDETTMKIEVIAFYEKYHTRTLEWNHEFKAWQLNKKHAGFNQVDAISFAIGDISEEILVGG